MEDIELVIKIPEDVYNTISGWDDKTLNWAELLLKYATPLQKGHGRLIDISNIDVIELEDSSHFIRHEKGDEVDVYISAPTIIEADREDSQG